VDVKKYLINYVKSVDSYFEEFFLQKEKEASKIDQLAVDVLKTLKDYISGGKKIRGALTVLGYQCAGGASLKDIIPVSAAVEIMHSCLLIHDDFVDNDEFRRGKPTVHKLYSRNMSEHYGASMAVIIGDVGIFLCNQILAASNFDGEKKALATYEFQKLLINTGYGELMDIAFDYKNNLSWDDILKIRIYKTSHYTFVMPLTVGALLAGSDKKVIEAIKKFGEPIGVAFQLRDDTLGIFGDSNKTGKSSESDIREGKKTLILTKALELSNRQDSHYLKRWYGVRDAKAGQIKKVRKIFKNSGACEYSEKLSRQLVEEGKRAIPQIVQKKKYQEVLDSLADYVIFRDK
jgi:geranylgeranyl diphosphate synthase type I